MYRTSLLILLLWVAIYSNSFSLSFDANQFISINNNSETGKIGFYDVTLDKLLINIIRSNDESELKNFPLANDRSIDLQLVRTRNIFDASAKFFMGNVPMPAPDLLTYTGTVNNQKDSKVIISISNGYMFGIFSMGDSVFYLSPSHENSDKYILTNNKLMWYPSASGSDDCPYTQDNINIIRKKYDDNRTLSNKLLELELAVETDTEFFKATGNDFKKAEAYLLTLLTQVSWLYQKFIDVRIKNTWLKIWTDNPSDPYNAKGDYSVLRDKAVQYWNDNYKNVERDLYHVCTSVNNGGGGFGYFDALCGNKQFGMAVTSLQGWNNLPTFDFAYDIYIIAHEIGHNFNAQHTHSCFWNNAPLDTCVVDNACLPPEQQPLPNPGSIMSYCGWPNLKAGFGYQVRMIFLDGNRQIMRKTAEQASCLDSVVQPALVLILPRGSEKFRNISFIDIRWKAYNATSVNISYTTDNGDSWMTIAAGVSGTDSVYRWNLPQLCSNKMKIKISVADNPDINALSLLPFTIKQDDPEGLVAYYPFNGNSNDEQTCHFYDAVNINNAQLTTDKFGNINRAFEFNGSNYLKADSFDMSFEKMTATFWFYLNNLNGKQNIIGSNYSEGWVFDAYYWGLFGVSFYLNGSGSPEQIWGGGLEANRWYFGAFTFDGKYAKLYVDGIMKGQKKWDTTVTLNKFRTPLYLGSRKDNDFMYGKLDEVRIYNRALSDAEIMGLTGLADNNTLTNNLKIYPNPASDKIDIEFLDCSDNAEIIIYDLTGMQVLRKYFEAGQRRIEMDVKSLVNGVYSLKVISERNIYFDKVIVFH